nr:ATPase, T2SS/T4P/T4SS family [Vibrio sinus]
MLLACIENNASDIHFEPYEKFARIRYRIDGILREYQRPQLHVYKKLIAHIKVLADLDISEQRKPQDGRFHFPYQNDQTIDLRISTLPTQWGEKLVLRILKGSHDTLRIDQLGMHQHQQSIFIKALQKPQGLILITGPTGSGKTVSLYAALQHLNTSEVNISTAEDPIEIILPGINQVQIKRKIELGFSEALRAFLRQDPDIIMLGEIRDLETAQITIKAAQTGHLVMSTLHTNSAAQTLMRLVNMGVDPYNLVSSISLVIAQRLVRRLCQHCKIPQDNTNNIKQHFEISSQLQLYQASPSGCKHCQNGYSGRIALFELVEIDEHFSALLSDSPTAAQVEQYMQSQDIPTLKDAAMKTVLSGLTSYQEVQRKLGIC